MEIMVKFVFLVIVAGGDVSVVERNEAGEPLTFMECMAKANSTAKAVPDAWVVCREKNVFVPVPQSVLTASR
jgi:hypothetical protein